MGIVKFGDVVERINIKVDQSNPQLNYMEHGRRIIIPIKYYVGGEHIEGSEFMVHKKALIQGSTIGYQFQFGFRKGDILFMTKNPHLRKASMVDFDGLCSIATFVIASKSNNLLQNYLLLEMQSDRFWQYCEDNKSGGVNYFINWGTLSNYEFDLPPIEKQKELADKLWAAYRLKEGYKRLLAAIDEMVKSQFIEMFGDCVNRIKLSSLCSTFVDGDWIESKDQSELGIRLIQTGNVGNGFFKDKEDKSRYISEETFDNLHCTEIYPGDILVSRLPDPIGRACIIPQGLGRTITAVDCTIIRLKDIILPDYFIAYTMTPSYVAQINEVTTGTTRRRVSRANLGNILIPCPSIAKQQQFVAIAKQADKSKFELKQCIENIDKVINSLINGK